MLLVAESGNRDWDRHGFVTHFGRRAIFVGGLPQQCGEWDMRVYTNNTISIVELLSNTTVAICLVINDGLL